MKACMIWILSLFTATVGSAFPPDDTAGSESVLRDPLLSFFSSIQSRHPEKLYLHLNQPYYGAGDTMWFKAYLTDAVSHKPDTLSNFIYVDLYDRAKRLVTSKKIKRDSMGFANCLPLADTLFSGEYTLRAYTGWMLNFDASGFFQKNIVIGQNISKVRHSVTYTDKRMVVRFLDRYERPLSKKEASFDLYDKNGKHLGSGTQRLSSTGAVLVPLPGDSSSLGAYADIRISIREDSVFRRTVFIEPLRATFDIQFLPEGGELVGSDQPQLVAFRAVRPDGSPAEVQGYLLNGGNDTVARFRSEHDGMGRFLLTPREGESYRAVAFLDTLSVSVSLPAVRDNACALQVVQGPRDIRYRILGKVPASGLLVGHTRGVCCLLHPVDARQNTGTIRTDSLPEGILHLLLTDSTGCPRTERLVYIRKPGSTPRFTVRADKPAYGAREKVRADISLKRGEQPLSGRFSVSVTDADAVKPDSLSDHIYTYLLLTSDLKGYVHNPGYYFLDDSPARQHSLDLVMLTHGWRRFRTDSLFRTAPFRPKFFFEHGQFFSGRVNNMFGKGVGEATLTAFASRGDGLGDRAFTATTDSAGHFLFEGLDFQDTTVFLIPFYNKKGKIPYEIHFEDTYYRPGLTPLAPYLSETIREKRLEEVRRASPPPTGLDSLTTYQIDEVVVHGRDPNAPALRIEKRLHKDTAQFAKLSTMSLEKYVQHFPGMKQMPLGWCIDMGGRMSVPLQFRLNGEVIMGTEFLNLYTVRDIEYIRTVLMPMPGPPLREFLPYLPIGTSPDYPCRFEIYLKEDAQGKRRFGLYRTVGYIPGAEFYHPVYDTPEKLANKTPDRRTTLYWEPYLQLGDDGKGSIEFYTNDKNKSRLEIVIEGIAADGSVCKTRQRLE